MKHKTFVVWALILLCAAALLSGCDNGTTGGKGGGSFSLTVGNNQKKYFSLSTGEEIPETQKATGNWDIAFTRSSTGTPPKGVYRLVLTNGGVTATAEGSSGQAKVWYVDTTDFDSVTAATSIPNDVINTTYNTDVTRYIDAAMGGASSPLERAMNVMTYVGYSNEGDANDGTSAEKYFSNSYQYNKKQFYKAGASMGEYVSTNQVYIIQHADGVTRSKIQITYEYQASPATDIYQVQYAPLR